MRYPNLRYGNPTELNYYAMSYTDVKTLARNLRRDERTVKDWLSGRQRVPWWVPEILRLQRMESADIMRQHTQHITGRQAPRQPLGVVTHEGQLELRRPDVQKPQPITALRLEDFDQPAELKAYSS